MNIAVEPGKYVVAVSGGVDSVVLLYLLMQQNELKGEHVSRTWSWKLVVAHFDHGIRSESRQDKAFVQRLAQEYGLPFVYGEGELGAHASEADAREARYEFLYKTRKSAGARAIITAHHQDDLLETAVLNILRGTGRKGLTSLRSTDIVKRPLLDIPKSELVAYAKRRGLKWREDSTNDDETYLRNYIRRRLLSRFDNQQRQALQNLIAQAHTTNEQLDLHLINYLHMQPAPDVLDRHSFIMLPHAVSREVLATWLRQRGVAEFDRRALERLVHAAKTYGAGKRTNITSTAWLVIHKQTLEIVIK